VKKWSLIDTTLTPDGKTVSLHEHDGSHTIRVDGADLMSTRRHGSEEKLAELACAHLKGVRGARVLIGGLGFGFTLKAALGTLPKDAVVVVAEILAAVIAWNPAIDDPRVTIRNVDVAEIIREPGKGFDSIILDVDNGPVAMTTESNARLYGDEGLQLARAALRPNGCIAIWSAKPDPGFAKVMTRAGFTVDTQRCRSHTIFLGRR
jgi:spermidine synthase